MSDNLHFVDWNDKLELLAHQTEALPSICSSVDRKLHFEGGNQVAQRTSPLHQRTMESAPMPVGLTLPGGLSVKRMLSIIALLVLLNLGAPAQSPQFVRSVVLGAPIAAPTVRQ